MCEGSVDKHTSAAAAEPGVNDVDANAAIRDASAAAAAPAATGSTTTGAPAAAPAHVAQQHAPIFSSNVSEPEVAQQQLSRLLAPAGRWSLSAHRKGVERAFQFKTFKKTWDFMDAVAAECRREKHHPEWANVYNRTHVRWTTHRPEGLSLKDLKMAQFCDERADEFGEEVSATAPPVATEQLGNRDPIQELSDRVANDGCEVCAR